MMRTQIQLPDALHRSSKSLADRMEISLSELVRRGLEYLLAVAPGVELEAAAWTLPEPHCLGAKDAFVDDDWRSQIHMERLKVAEDGTGYGSERSAP